MSMNGHFRFLCALFFLGVTSPWVFGQGTLPLEQTVKDGKVGAEVSETRIKPGDMVVVSKDGAILKVETKVVAQLKKGTRIAVTHVQDIWVAGNITVDGKLLRGWVRMSDVIPAIVIDNVSDQPCNYQVRLSGNQQWGQPFTLAPGQHHTYTPDNRLVIRLQNGDDWPNWILDPGRHVRYRQDAAGNGELVDYRFDEPGRPKTRQIAVFAVADETYRHIHPEWKDRIAEIVATASVCYEDAFSLRLKLVDCQPWHFEAARHGKMDEVMKTLLRIDRPQADALVIGWIGVAQAGPAADQYTYACSNFFGRHMLIADVFSVMRTTRMLVHCLGRNFGAFGVVDRRCVMHRDLGTTYPIEFGDVARQVILLTREFDLRTGVRSLTPENARQIRELYRQFHHPHDSPDDDPIKNGYRTLELYRSIRSQPSIPRSRNTIMT
jgi:hypothetical protein